MNFRKTKFVIGGAFILVGVGIVLATNLPKSMQYYVTVDELLAQERTLLGKELKVAGKVQDGSIQSMNSNMLHTFKVVNAGKVISVTYHGALPDTFKAGADVVVTGTFKEGGQLAATDVLAKCASKYEEKLKPGYDTPARKGT